VEEIDSGGDVTMVYEIFGRMFELEHGMFVIV